MGACESFWVYSSYYAVKLALLRPSHRDRRRAKTMRVLFEPSPHHWRWPFSDDGWPDVSHFIERAACAWSRAATKSWQELSQVQVRRQHCTMSDAAQSRPKFTISSSSSSVPLMTMR